MRTISEFIQFKLEQLNKSHAGIKNVAASNEAGIQRVRDAMERANKNLDKISFEGIEIDKKEIKLPIPEAFKRRKPMLYQTVAGDLALEVIR